MKNAPARVALLGATMLLLILPLTVGREMQWPWWTFASLAASVAGAAAFLGWQRHLGRTGVWVAAYGFAGPIYPRLPKPLAAWCGPAGALVMAAAFAATALTATLHGGTGPLLIVLLGCGGFGFGLMQTALTSQLTATVPKERAPDLSGVLSTMTPLSAVIGIATFGSAYLILAEPGGALEATHAFARVNVAFAVTAGFAAVGALVALRGERVRALRESRLRLDLVKQVD